MQPDAFADMVVLTVKAALAPVLERLAASEHANRELQAQVGTLAELRDRLTAMETKAAALVIPQPPDLAPVLERIAVAETHAKRHFDIEVAVSDMRERLAAVERSAQAIDAKASALVIPSPPDLTPVLERIAVTETHVKRQGELESALGQMRERLAVVEESARVPGQGAPQATEAVLTPPASVADLEVSFTKQIAGLSERLAVVETRAPVPGPQGPAGKDGQDGRDGKDGADGFGLEDFSVDFDGDRTMLLKFERGELKKTWPIQLPYMKFEGLHQVGRAYVKGDVVMHGGHMWFCHAVSTTAKPGETKDWQLCVQRGRDGKAGRDGMDLRPTPVVSLGKVQ